MADEEAEQESGSLGGDLLELRRLRERLVELETGLRESSEPAVQAATEYCKQLCQELEYDPLPRAFLYMKTSTISSSTCSCDDRLPDVTIRWVFTDSEKYHQQNISCPFNIRRRRFLFFLISHLVSYSNQCSSNSSLSA